MIQWSEKNKYTSFSSMKGLCYYSHYKKIVDWMDGNGKLPPPIECNLDIFAECNLSCSFCNAQRFLKVHREEVGEMRKLPTDYIFKLIGFLAKWGVKGICLSGGGEPTLHKKFVGLPEYIVSKGMKASMFTNGTVMTESLANSMLVCQFVSFSLNATDRETYKKIMGVDLFDRMRTNVKYLAKRQHETGSGTFTCVRMLVLPENYHQIYQMCLWAKEIGLKGFNVRPVDFERSDIEGHRKLELPIDFIQEQFAKCHEEETDDFKVFTVTEKYDDKFHVQQDYSECLATPLLIPILQDGYAYCCVDRKMESRFKMFNCFPNPEKLLDFWGSDEHRAFLKGICIKECQGLRCTFSKYNRQISEVVKKDSMMLSFP